MTTTEKLTYSIDEVAVALGISRPIAYQLAHRADFPAVWLSERRVVVPVVALKTWLSQQTQGGDD